MNKHAHRDIRSCISMTYRVTNGELLVYKYLRDDPDGIVFRIESYPCLSFFKADARGIKTFLKARLATNYDELSIDGKAKFEKLVESNVENLNDIFYIITEKGFLEIDLYIDGTEKSDILDIFRKLIPKLLVKIEQIYKKIH